MNTVSIHEAEKKLAGIISKTLSDNDETIIVTDKGSVVLIDEKEWEQMKETLLLFNDKKSLTALLDGHKLRESCQRPEGKSVEEVFTDV